MSLGTAILKWQFAQCAGHPGLSRWVLLLTASSSHPRGGTKDQLGQGREEITHPLVPYPHIPVMTGGEAISIFFIPFDLWGTGCKEKSGEESGCPQPPWHRSTAPPGRLDNEFQLRENRTLQVLTAPAPPLKRKWGQKINELTHRNRLRVT